MTATLLEAAISALVVLGGLFGLVGSWGMLRLRNPFQRLHAPTKATTIGVGTALVASDLEIMLLQGRIAWEEIAVAVFLFLTAPLSAMMLAKVLLWDQKQTRKTDLAVPPPEGGGEWAVWTPDVTAGDRMLDPDPPA
ncbi:MAG: monovalent cation/H(+) antiporter subunit G [Paracoccaceae bacterium]